jgi:hypothetical protein
MAAAPIFTATPRMVVAQVSAANTNRDGTGTIVDLITGVAAGTRINKITIKAIVTTTAGIVRIYFYDGTNTRLYREVPVTAITVSTSVAGFEYELLFDDSDAPVLATNTQKLQASTHNAETFNIIVEAADY